MLTWFLLFCGAFIGAVVAVCWGLVGAVKGWPLRIVGDYTAHGRSAGLLYFLSALVGAAVLVRLVSIIIWQ
jgi:uncharacterized membrane protein YeaQ/YmgE (transglycosylase-associated protein family)